jgi:hypothetical protein
MSDTTRRPNMDKQPGEDMTSSHGPHAPVRERRPEHTYPAIERETGTNRRDAAAPGGPVTIPVKGGATPEGDKPAATGRGSRDSSAGLAED